MKRLISLNTTARYICIAALGISIYACKGKEKETEIEETTTTREPAVVGQEDDKEVTVTKQTDASGKVTATITTSTSNGDEVRTEDRLIRGTPEEVDAKIKELKIK